MNLARLALSAAVALVSTEARAGSFEVSPVIIDLAKGEHTAVIEVRNRGGAPLAAQVRAYVWTQLGDVDTLVPADDVILSPPLFTVPTDQVQVVRLLMRGGARATEREFRLLIDEVPSVDDGKNRIAIKLEMSLPVFVPPIAAGAPALTWRVQTGRDGKSYVTATNTGSRYARVSLLNVQAADGALTRLPPDGANPYVLPGATRRWTMTTPAGDVGAPVHLDVTTQIGKTELSLTPSR